MDNCLCLIAPNRANCYNIATKNRNMDIFLLWYYTVVNARRRIKARISKMFFF